ncbi:MAG: hypothetical protein EZS28_017079 [Streblomastix strix]|uniref:Uncharacterized protein n=1 Tax=Streblomastix strix TaxID=222440 RepID=A0A5J4VYV0_9EUKA|nr:MAG: hypothetical protein EZS28_017079 [Streblomastix strix]
MSQKENKSSHSSYSSASTSLPSSAIVSLANADQVLSALIKNQIQQTLRFELIDEDEDDDEEEEDEEGNKQEKDQQQYPLVLLLDCFVQMMYFTKHQDINIKGQKFIDIILKASFEFDFENEIRIKGNEKYQKLNKQQQNDDEDLLADDDEEDDEEEQDSELFQVISVIQQGIENSGETQQIKPILLCGYIRLGSYVLIEVSKLISKQNKIQKSVHLNSNLQTNASSNMNLNNSGNFSKQISKQKTSLNEKATPNSARRSRRSFGGQDQVKGLGVPIFGYNNEEDQQQANQDIIPLLFNILELHESPLPRKVAVDCIVDLIMHLTEEDEQNIVKNFVDHNLGGKQKKLVEVYLQKAQEKEKGALIGKDRGKAKH